MRGYYVFLLKSYFFVVTMFFVTFLKKSLELAYLLLKVMASFLASGSLK